MLRRIREWFGLHYYTVILICMALSVLSPWALLLVWTVILWP